MSVYQMPKIQEKLDTLSRSYESSENYFPKVPTSRFQAGREGRGCDGCV